jgi:hypothetical protein
LYTVDVIEANQVSGVVCHTPKWCIVNFPTLEMYGTGMRNVPVSQNRYHLEDIFVSTPGVGLGEHKENGT